MHFYYYVFTATVISPDASEFRYSGTDLLSVLSPCSFSMYIDACSYRVVVASRLRGLRARFVMTVPCFPSLADASIGLVLAAIDGPRRVHKDHRAPLPPQPLSLVSKVSRDLSTKCCRRTDI